MYNSNQLQDFREKIIRKYDKQLAERYSMTSPGSRHVQTSESESTPCSPQRPSSLNVTPVYHCRHHLAAGIASIYFY